MKTLRHASTVAMIALAASVVFGQQTAHANAQESQAKPTASMPEEYDKQLAKMQAEMTRMQEQMRKIQQTRDPQERQRILQDHWTSMQNMMTLMHGSNQAGGHMMGGHMMGGQMMMWGDYKNLPPEQLKQRQYMMDQSMPMQQMMMDQMMQHQYWMMQPAAPVTPPK